jgi:hypothetical protein
MDNSTAELGFGPVCAAAEGGGEEKGAVSGRKSGLRVWALCCIYIGQMPTRANQARETKIMAKKTLKKATKMESKKSLTFVVPVRHPGK